MSHPICIKCSSKAKVTSFHSLHQRGGVGQVGLWGSPTKVLQRDTVDGRVRWGPQFITQDPTDIGAHYCETTRGEYSINSLISHVNNGSRGVSGE